MDDIVALSAVQLSDAIRQRRLSCRETMQAYLRHIAALNPRVNAIVSLRDAGELLREADACDDELARGQYRGWMHGMPQAIKDLALTRGIPTTMGSPLMRDFVPGQDGIVVERMKRAGAIVIGKTNVPEFGFGSQTYNPVFGATGNAYDPALTAGGSSGGAAAALALHLLPVADGSDMMGSLRNPAAYNNVFGFRPSFGRVPMGPAMDLYGAQLATEGPMGRTVADVARLLATQAGFDVRAPLSLTEDASVLADLPSQTWGDVRIGWLADWNGHLPMEPGVLSLCAGALQVFEALGCRVEAVTPQYPPQRLWQAWVTLRQWGAAGRLSAFYDDARKRALLKPEAVWEIEHGRQLSGQDVYAANVARSDWYRETCRLFERYDYLLLPSAQVFPFDIHTHWPASIAGRSMDTYHRWMEVVVAGSMAGGPVLNVPAGFNGQGLPMGLQILGPHHADAAVLQLGQAYEAAIPHWLRVRPALLDDSGDA